MIYIQHSNPRTNTSLSSDFDDLSDAFENTFDLNTEDAILRISHILINISYKYDVAYLIEDMLQPLESLTNSDNASAKVTFVSDNLPYVLEMNKKNDLVIVCLREKVVCSANSLGRITCEENIRWADFLCEWLSFFEFALNLLVLSGYNLKDNYIYNAVNRLSKTAKLSGCKGYLYK